MTSKCIVVTILIYLSCCSCRAEISPGKLFKYYEKLNKHFDKHVLPQQSRPENLMRETEFLLEVKLSQCITFCDKSYIETLKMLTKLKALSTDQYDCVFYKERAFLELIDSGLKDSSRQKNANYRRTAVDRMIEYYVFRAFEHCGFEGNLPTMNYALRQNAYDTINDKLEETLPGVGDVEQNMKVARDLLRKLEAQDGALAKALEQFLALQDLLSWHGTCDVEGSGILLKNALALRGLNHRYFHQNLRRINMIYQYYARKHEEMCRAGYRRNMRRALDENLAWPPVLGLASSFYLDTWDYTALVKSLAGKPVNDELTIPLMVNYAKGIQDRFKTSMLSLPHFTFMDNNKILNYVRELYKADNSVSFQGNDAQFKYLAKTQRVYNGEKIWDHYLFTPCKYYMADIGRLVEADEFAANANDQHLKSQAGKLVEDLTYHMVRAGYQACKYVLLNQEYIFS